MFKKIIEEAVNAGLKNIFKGDADDREEKIAMMKDMDTAKLKLSGAEAQYESKKTEVARVKLELDGLKAQHAREDTEIKHNMKIIKERGELEVEKAKNASEAKYQQKELALLKEHQKTINKMSEDNLKGLQKQFDTLSATFQSAVSVDIKKRSGR